MPWRPYNDYILSKPSRFDDPTMNIYSDVLHFFKWKSLHALGDPTRIYILPTYITFSNGKTFTPWETLLGIYTSDVLHLFKWKSLHALGDPTSNIYPRRTSLIQNGIFMPWRPFNDYIFSKPSDFGDPKMNIYSRRISPFQTEKPSRLGLPGIYIPDEKPSRVGKPYRNIYSRRTSSFLMEKPSRLGRPYQEYIFMTYFTYPKWNGIHALGYIIHEVLHRFQIKSSSFLGDHSST
ncbi:hypothetical protein CEXT_307051 [Caerostris extrusa]|uniref:Uncharacterized protein n=1 Tax=Caerostris extrusa TaxID=172846 RepID=A0AAV4QI11_CAEEX|nr:hypothetical protein CEXT_307051 [Caerostris extrusa]